jgi:hypothetical protein
VVELRKTTVLVARGMCSAVPLLHECRTMPVQKLRRGCRREAWAVRLTGFRCRHSLMDYHGHRGVHRAEGGKLMPSTRLRIDSAAPGVTSQAAASGNAALMQAPPSLAPTAAANTFDVAVTALAGWASTLQQGVTVTAHGRGAAVGAVSASGFTNLGVMDEDNAVRLEIVRQEL